MKIQKINQETFSDLLKLMKITTSEHAKLLASFFKKQGYCDDEFRISYYKDHILELQDYLSKFDDQTAYISDLAGKFVEINFYFYQFLNFN